MIVAGFVLAFIIVAVVGISALLRSAKEYDKGVELANRFRNLGNLRGKSYSQICNAVGYTAGGVRSTSGGRIYTTRTWALGTYKIVLLFDENDLFCEIVSEELKPFTTD